MTYSKEFIVTLEKSKKRSSTVSDLIEAILHKKEEKKSNPVVDITITVSKKTPKRKVRVFSNFVKVGWDQYSIKHDAYTGYEYVVIKGNRYEVVRDIFGQGYLVEL